MLSVGLKFYCMAQRPNITLIGMGGDKKQILPGKVKAKCTGAGGELGMDIKCMGMGGNGTEIHPHADL